MDSAVTIVWFRHDLRLDDNPALAAAARRGSVVPVFIWAPEEERPWEPGAASRWWLHQSLERLAAAAGLCQRRVPVLHCRGLLPGVRFQRRQARQQPHLAGRWAYAYPAAVRE